ncbi:acyl-CoA carboxylase epsilon subunit [Actinoplanes sp. NPDC051851]|uniref:acyl-CoA carboxylase epsilon subunit n=1 Tax=Actinoplanes sp. NPDC051851 TaxID=3154753 RepID=UPI003425FCF7
MSRYRSATTSGGEEDITQKIPGSVERPRIDQPSVGHVSYAQPMFEEPLVSVVHGSLDDHELAAMVAILASRSTSVNSGTSRRNPSDWIRSARPSAGTRSWKSSGLPR